MIDPIRKLSLSELCKKLHSKQISVAEVVKAYTIDPGKFDYLHCFQEKVDKSVDNKKLWEQVAESQRKIDSGAHGALEGVPLVFKDNYCVVGTKTQAGSTMLSDFVAPYTGTVAQKLLDQGCIYFGKANMDPFAMGSGGNSDPLVLSPWSDVKNNKFYLAGGSSSGSASLVAAGLAVAAMGSDTGGSVRQPAAWCGLVGYRPTYGLCSRYGIIGFASSLDQAGVLTKTVLDNALIMKHAIGFDEKDCRSYNGIIDDLEAACYKGETEGLSGIKIGILDCFEKIPLSPDVRTKYEELKKKCQEQGATIVMLSSDLSAYSVQAYYIISSIEGSSNLARYNGIHNGKRSPHAKKASEISAVSRGENFSPEVLRRILIGSHFLQLEFKNGYYTLAKKFQDHLKQHIKNLFQSVDVVLMPTVTETAWSLERHHSADVVDTWDSDIFTVWSAVAGVPSINFPAGMTANNMPIGFQLSANYYNDALMFRVAAAMEKINDAIELPFVN